MCYLLQIIKYSESMLCSFNLLFLIIRRRDSLHSVDKNNKSCYKIDNNVFERNQKAVTENFKIK